MGSIQLGNRSDGGRWEDVLYFFVVDTEDRPLSASKPAAQARDWKEDALSSLLLIQASNAACMCLSAIFVGGTVSQTWEAYASKLAMLPALLQVVTCQILCKVATLDGPFGRGDDMESWFHRVMLTAELLFVGVSVVLPFWISHLDYIWFNLGFWNFIHFFHILMIIPR